MMYRPDIDGLRAIAVVSIVLFHAGISSLSGGFVGVDIFFVISGYLITSIIVHEMEVGDFSIVNFYRRRIIRIFPALFVMLILVLAAGYFFLLPYEIQRLGRSAAAAAGFVSNNYFWQNSGYFSGASHDRPLLHTWSLGVEEQFYICYPILLLLLRRFFRASVLSILSILTVGSFFLSFFLAVNHPMAGFYLLPSRAWELGLGGMVALGAFPRVATVGGREALGLAGIVAIALGLLLINSNRFFPAPWALLPCIGTALLIAYGQSTKMGRLLATAPFRSIGKISYSLYLWHWPIIVLYSLNTGRSLVLSETVVLIAVSVAAATLSYGFVEQLFLTRFRQSRPWPILINAGTALVAVTCAALVFSAEAGNWRDYAPNIRRVADYGGYRNFPEFQYQFRKGKCMAGKGDTFDQVNCLALSKTEPNVIVLGDSQAAQYWRALSLHFPDLNVLQATGSGCRPTVDSDGPPRCTNIVDYVLGPLTDDGKVAKIVLAGRWRDADLDKLDTTIHMIRSKNIDVTVIGPTVEYDGQFPQLLARAMMRFDLASLAEYRVNDRKQLDDKMKIMVPDAGASYISAYDIECPNGHCRLFDRDGGPFHFDYGHLTFSAARDIVDKIATF